MSHRHVKQRQLQAAAAIGVRITTPWPRNHFLCPQNLSYPPVQVAKAPSTAQSPSAGSRRSCSTLAGGHRSGLPKVPPNAQATTSWGSSLTPRQPETPTGPFSD
ncbi:unnamed protein product [Protopolystoma xenopodis]|uniref:Uncharacterized protein n=1 Tax=Protopolystoma xenopodis TaxID=117903 RepID=A0A448X119_9PLAT|nr:unnamed protein product [Protopolystoma xenopodis]